MEKIIIDLTQEQINTMVHDSCVLFCKYCGCGLPRETCTSLGTCKEHDEYRAAIRTRFMEKKKKEYPKTYEECCDILQLEHTFELKDLTIDEEKLTYNFIRLKRCRDAYWKIAGEEMELEKPWEPDWSIYEHKFCLGTDKDKVIEECVTTGNRILAFPTEEMRDAFYGNFKELINSCKELL